jgi:DNA-binding SARP family transcriptional activator/pimeloyl-ACP methyl ester carboxylesterase
MARLSIRLLGGLRSERAAGVPVFIRRRKARALLAYLALRPGSEYSRESLAALLWPDMADVQARHNLRQAMLAVRQTLAMESDLFAGDGEMLALDPAAVTVDVPSFERCVRADTPGALLQAAALYQGDLLEGFSIDEGPFESWLAGERQRLRELAIGAFDRLLSVDVAAGALERAAQTGVRLVALDPLRESAHRSLMILYARQGRRTAALRQYQICADALRRELGVKPEPATTELYQQILKRHVPSPATATAMATTETPTPTTRYAKSGDLNIAYQCIGDGPLDLVLVPGWVSNVECFWEEPRVVRFFRRLASFARLIVFDKRGTGLSDRVPESAMPTLEQRMDDLRTVMDAAGSKRAVLVGYSEGGPMCALFAATYPARTAGLVMIGSYPRIIKTPDFPWGYTPDTYLQRIEALGRDWGGPITLDRRAPSVIHDEAFVRWWGRFLRMGASPAAAMALSRLNLDLDVRHVLAAIRVPTLLLHAVGDQTIDVECSRYMAAHIPRARYVELPSGDHLPWLSDADIIVDEIARFAAAADELTEPDHLLVTVMAVELTSAASGDAPGVGSETRYQEVVRVDTVRYRGRLLVTTGRTALAAFDGPARAVRCARAIVDDLARAGMTARAGLHTGECELRPDALCGEAVDAARRIAAEARDGDVVVSSTVKDLVAGAAIDFRPRTGIRGAGGQRLSLFSLA